MDMNKYEEIWRDTEIETNTCISVCLPLPAVFFAACGLKMRNGCFV